MAHLRLLTGCWMRVSIKIWLAGSRLHSQPAQNARYCCQSRLRSCAGTRGQVPSSMLSIEDVLYSDSDPHPAHHNQHLCCKMSECLDSTILYGFHLISNEQRKPLLMYDLDMVQSFDIRMKKNKFIIPCVKWLIKYAWEPFLNMSTYFGKVLNPGFFKTFMMLLTWTVSFYSELLLYFYSL